MELLPDDLRVRLPPLHAQEAEADPHVFARYVLPGSSLAWYVIEGEPCGDSYSLFGFAAGGEQDFCCFGLSELAGLRGPNSETVQRDLTFLEGRLTEVVPAPDC